MNRYGYSVADPVMELFSHCPKRQRELLLRAFAQLADAPSTHADFVERPAGQHPVSVTRLGHWLISWWPDHAVKVIRIVDVCPVQ